MRVLFLNGERYFIDLEEIKKELSN
ncbi:hypothetical protein FAIPA1_140023 [Frankia sp. AiPs1]